MEKLNNESNVSRETSKNEIKIIFKNRCADIISIHRIEIYDVKNDLEKTVSYVVKLLYIYKVDGYALIYYNDRYVRMVDLKEMKCY